MKKLKPKNLPAFFTMGITALLLMACNFSIVDLVGTGGVSSTEEPIFRAVSPTPNDTPTPEPPPPASGHIVFVSARDGKKKLYVMNADGSNQRALTRG